MRGLKVTKDKAEIVLSILSLKHLIHPKYKVSSDKTYVYIPTLPSVLGSVLSSALEGIPYDIIEFDFQPRRPRNSSLKQYLKSKIPVDLELPTSFDIIGDIAVIDIKDELLSYKEVIAEGILQTSPKIRTVYRKLKAVSGEFRLRELELLAGIDNSETVHREYGVNLHLDIRKVYFSPRLSSEHWRIAQLVQDHEYILDMFTATGIFPLLISKNHDVEVVALDHNPSGIRALEKNILKNKLIGTIEALCLDANTYENDIMFDRILMNHPSGANNFLKKADSLLKKGGILHFYTFLDMDTYQEDAVKILHSYLPNYRVHHVQRIRQYSPTQYHVCIDAEKY